MNREQKAAAITEIAEQITESDAVFAVDYRGITVAEVGELRGKLREADSSFRVVKNTLTERAADAADASALKEHLEGPTALTFVRGDAAAAAKVIADFQKSTGGELLPFKGGIVNGEVLDASQITAISKLPSRQVLYGQLVGIVASPISGLARSLNGLVSGLAVALGGVLEGKQDGSIPAGDAPAAAAIEEAKSADADSDEGSADAEPSAEAEAPTEAEAPVADEAPAEETEEAPAEEPAAEAAPETNDDSEASAEENENPTDDQE